MYDLRQENISNGDSKGFQQEPYEASSVGCPKETNPYVTDR